MDCQHAVSRFKAGGRQIGLGDRLLIGIRNKAAVDPDLGLELENISTAETID